MQKIKQYLASLLLGVLVLTPFAQVAQSYSEDVLIYGIANNMFYRNDVYVSYSAINGAQILAATINGEVLLNQVTAVDDEGLYGVAITSRKTGESAKTTNRNFTIDKTAPTVSINGVASNQTYNSSVNPTYTASDNFELKSVYATLNGQSFASGSTISDDGLYGLEVTATDKAGNSKTTNVNFTIESTSGKDGKDGEDGKDGADGEDGEDGTDGEDGEDGTDGQNGTDGTSTTSYINRYISNGYSGTSVAKAQEEVADQEIDDANYLTDLGIISIESDTCSADVNACENVRIIGKAKEGLLVILYLQREGDDTPIIGFVRARAGNIFEFVTDEPLEAGEYLVYAKAAEEGGKTGPIILLDTFEVEECAWWVAWLWILLILILIVLGFLLGMYLRRRNNEFDEFEEIEEQPEVPEMPQSRL